MDRRLEGKIAIITGAGQGIGKGIALRLSGEGATAVIAEGNPDTAAATAGEITARRGGGQALAYPLDVSSGEAVRRMVREVVRRFGRIDILVNNAGVMQTKPLLDLSEEDWDR